MFTKGEYVFHETGGICLIEDVRFAPLEHMPADRQYYVMKPMHDPNSVIYIPVDSDRIFLRRLLDREAAEELLDRIPFVRVIEEQNGKLLRAKYTELMHTYDPLEWVRVIKTVYLRAQPQSGRASRVSDTERAFAERARRHLHAELALALGLREQDMEAYITEHIQRMA